MSATEEHSTNSTNTTTTEQQNPEDMSYVNVSNPIESIPDINTSPPSEIFEEAQQQMDTTKGEEIVFMGRQSRPHSPTATHRTSISTILDRSRPHTPVAGKKNQQQYHQCQQQQSQLGLPEMNCDFLNCEQISIIAGADIALLVGSPTSPDRRKIMVSSTVLSIGSSYFRAVLSPNRFTEGITFQTHKYLELNLYDDDPVAVTMVCHILHLQSQKIPKQLTGDELAEVAIVLDKYDCVDAAWAWTRHWMAGEVVKRELVEDGNHGEELAVGNIGGDTLSLTDTKEKSLLSKWVFIAWVFRDDQVFSLCANALAWKMLQGNQEDDDYFQRLPESLQRDLVNTRLSCISDLNDCTQSFIDKFVEDGVCDVGGRSLYYYGNHLPRDCDARVIGTTLKGLREAELYPTRKIEKWANTASELLGDLRAVGKSIFCADEHHHTHTPSSMFLESLEIAKDGMRKFAMDDYVRS